MFHFSYIGNALILLLIEISFRSRDVRCLSSPNQPGNRSFPKNSTGRSFQQSWLHLFPWLHYDEEMDAVFCFACLKAIENGSTSVITTLQSDAFTKSGYNNWKKAMEKNKGFKAHQLTNAHKEALARYIQHKPSDASSIDQRIDRTLRVQQLENRKMLLKILSNIRFLGKYSDFFHALNN